MKEMKKLVFTMLAFAFVFALSMNTMAQKGEEVKEKKIKIKMLGEKDGEHLMVDTAFALDEDFDKEQLKAALKEKLGEDFDMEFNFDFEFDTDKLLKDVFVTIDVDDTSKVKTIVKKIRVDVDDQEDMMIWTTEDEDIEVLDKDGEKIIISNMKVTGEDGEKKVIIKKAGDHFNIKEHKDAIWYEIETEEGDEKEFRVKVKSLGDHDGEHMIFISDDGEHVEIKDDIKVFVGEDHKHCKKIKMHKEGLHEFHVIKEMSCVKISDAEKNELEAAGLSDKGNGLNIENICIAYSKEDNEVMLKFSLDSEGKTSIHLIDEHGEEMFSDKVKYFPGTYHKSIGKDLEKGIYFIRIAQGGASFTKKISIM